MEIILLIWLTPKCEYKCESASTKMEKRVCVCVCMSERVLMLCSAGQINNLMLEKKASHVVQLSLRVTLFE